jgi:hypothetical protein
MGTAPAARRAMLYSLETSALTGGGVALCAWLAFRFGAAAVVAGGAGIAAGVLALFARKAPLQVARRPGAVRGGLLLGYATSLVAAGALLVRAGAGA